MSIIHDIRMMHYDIDALLELQHMVVCSSSLAV